MGFLNSLFSNIVSVGASIVGVAINLVSEFKEKVKETVYNLQTNHEVLKHELNNEYLKSSEINNEIQYYREKQIKDKILSEYDKEKVKELQFKRSLIGEKIGDIKEDSLAIEIANNNNQYDTINIQNHNLHILQYHVGKSITGKICRKCGRPMMLQWKRNKEITSINEFFWGCSGFYFKQNKCNNTEPFTSSDHNLFTNNDIPEFSISNNELNRIVDIKSSQNIIKNRLDGITNQAVSEYICPFHNEPLVLREKREPLGLLDSYYLTCPRTDLGCSFKEKMKSPGQLTAVLEHFYGRGIL